MPKYAFTRCSAVMAALSPSTSTSREGGADDPGTAVDYIRVVHSHGTLATGRRGEPYRHAHTSNRARSRPPDPPTSLLRGSWRRGEQRRPAGRARQTWRTPRRRRRAAGPPSSLRRGRG